MAWKGRNLRERSQLCLAGCRPAKYGHRTHDELPTPCSAIHCLTSSCEKWYPGWAPRQRQKVGAGAHRYGPSRWRLVRAGKVDWIGTDCTVSRDPLHTRHGSSKLIQRCRPKNPRCAPGTYSRSLGRGCRCMRPAQLSPKNRQMIREGCLRKFSRTSNGQGGCVESDWAE